MKQLGVSTYQLLLFVLAIFVFTAFFAAFPVKALALDATTQTSKVLPVGGNVCTPVSATNFIPYVYDGALHSFEFTVSDASYVALIGSVGNTSIPFNLMTRKIDASGMLHVRVDIQTTPIVGTLPLKVTLLSARSGNPVCLTVVSIGVGSGPVVVQSNPVVGTVPTTVSAAPATPGISFAPKPSSSKPAPTTQQVLTTSASKDSVVGTVQNAFGKVCASDASAYRLWLILLVLYMLIVGAVLWAEFPMSMPWARTPERIATIILVLLLLLLAFWYLSISCRAALWMPLVAFLVAVLGLLAAFWNHPRVTQLLLIQETKTTSTTILVPPAKPVIPQPQIKK
ncbi:hypothetical protein EXS56_01400 [Candidatus Kaiserbacteria bacterium]|nr:hypothetical protein [Candidatus Kaiserbacteria bacterium]